MKRAKQDYQSLLVRYKETKCKVEMLNEELTEAYSKIKFLELEVIQVNAKVERVSSKKLDEVLAHQKPFLEKKKNDLGYTRESSSSANASKEMKFVKAKEPVVATPTTEKVKFEKKPKENLFQSHKGDHKLNTFVIIVESKDTLDLIATSFRH